MTTIADLTKRLQIQAKGTDSADCHGNLADYIWMMKHQGVASPMDQIWEAMLQDFEELNCVLRTGEETGIERSLVYAVNGLLTACVNEAAPSRFDESFRIQMYRLTWRIVTAWDAILAGDIDSIQEHVQMEELARTVA